LANSFQKFKKKVSLIVSLLLFWKVKCECGKSVLKEDCCFVRAKWYCSESCALGITSKEKEE